MIKQNVDPGRNDVSICLDQSGTFRQPVTFRCCPLGIQFYTDDALQEDLMLEVAVNLPDADGHMQKICCCGVVVQSVLEDTCKGYRNWVYFVDLAPSIKQQLHCLAKESEFLCPYCENF
ncbi:MAG TPA: hypothetical protein PKM67_07225 [Kiritimatiellia bacterium]|nr:hypothetical protein [Kiritimatiellia bacterium]HNS81232.1 hypothetical protein [Kiritimatiellia bacterium]